MEYNLREYHEHVSSDLSLDGGIIGLPIFNLFFFLFICISYIFKQ